MITCKVCGFDNEAGARFCGSCGSFLEWTGEASDDSPTTVTPTGSPAPQPAPPGPVGVPTVRDETTISGPPPAVAGSGEIVCRSCGLVNERDRVFCKRCAAELLPAAAEPVGPAPVTARTRPELPIGPIILVGAIALVVIGAVVVGGGLLGRTATATASPGPSIAPTSSSIAVGSPTASPSAEVTASPSPTLPPLPTGTIAFSSSVGGNVDIMVAAPDGSGLTQLIGGPGAEVQPAWSRAGSRIAYGGPDGIRLANADGTKGVQFTHHGADDRKPEWSPDDKIIAFASRRDGDFEIFLRRVGDDDLVRLSENRGADYDPSWSVVRNRIAFVSERGGGRDVWTMTPAGKDPVQLTGDEGAEDDPAWSPDGERIAFASDREGTFAIFVMNADGSDPRRLTTGSAVEHDPAWSPDGRFIAFARAGDPGAIVIVAAEDGTEVGTIGEPGGGASFPTWR